MNTIKPRHVHPARMAWLATGNYRLTCSSQSILTWLQSFLGFVAVKVTWLTDRHRPALPAQPWSGPQNKVFVFLSFFFCFVSLQFIFLLFFSFFFTWRKDEMLPFVFIATAPPLLCFATRPPSVCRCYRVFGRENSEPPLFSSLNAPTTIILLLFNQCCHELIVCCAIIIHSHTGSSRRLEVRK